MITWLLLLAFNVCKYICHSHMLTWTARESGHCLTTGSLPSLVPLFFSQLMALGVVILVHHFHRQSFLIKRYKDLQSAMRIEQLKAEKQRLEYERMMAEQSSHRLSHQFMSRHLRCGGALAEEEPFHDCDSIDPSDSAV